MKTRQCSFHFYFYTPGGMIVSDWTEKDDALILERISFDGYGCCTDQFSTMNAFDSQFILALIKSDHIKNNQEVIARLKTYFSINPIWTDALKKHGLL
jgi:hypothetical protein